MAAKVRKQIYLEPEQEARLKQLSVETGIPEAEIIREAIERRLDEMKAQQDRIAALVLVDTNVDAQIWAAARLAGITIVLTEDFNSGAVIEGVRFVNPFTPEFELADWL